MKVNLSLGYARYMNVLDVGDKEGRPSLIFV